MTPEERRAKNKAYHAKHYAANREKIIARNAAYSAANREKEAARAARYRADNLESVRAREAEYRANNLPKARARNVRHRATLHGHISTLVSSAKQRAKKEGLPFALTKGGYHHSGVLSVARGENGAWRLIRAVN